MTSRHCVLGVEEDRPNRIFRRNYLKELKNKNKTNFFAENAKDNIVIFRLNDSGHD